MLIMLLFLYFIGCRISRRPVNPAVSYNACYNYNGNNNEAAVHLLHQPLPTHRRRRSLPSNQIWKTVPLIMSTRWRIYQRAHPQNLLLRRETASLATRKNLYSMSKSSPNSTRSDQIRSWSVFSSLLWTGNRASSREPFLSAMCSRHLSSTPSEACILPSVSARVLPSKARRARMHALPKKVGLGRQSHPRHERRETCYLLFITTLLILLYLFIYLPIREK